MKEILRQRGLKATRGRLQVLKLMQRSNRPMSASEVYAAISDTACSSLSTVYRILNQLTEVGLLEASMHKDEVTYYEYKTEVHNHYIVCSECGKFTPIRDCPLDALDTHIVASTSYDITGHLFQLQGICPDCQKANP